MTRRSTLLVYMYTPRLLARKFPDCLARLVPRMDAINARGELLGSFLVGLWFQRRSEAIVMICVKFGALVLTFVRISCRIVLSKEASVLP